MDNKIAFVINTLNVGGAAKMLKYVANVATEIFDSVTIISIYDKDIDQSSLNPDIELLGLGFNNKNRFIRQFTMVPTLNRAIKRLSPKFVCSFVGHVNVMARLATLLMKDLIMISAERGDPFTQPIIWKWFTKLAYSKSNYCFFQLEEARDFFGDDIKQRSFIIPNPYTSNYPVTPYYGYRNQTIVSAGRFDFEKCYNDLIEAFAIVQKKHPQYKLILYGKGPMLESYIRQVKRLGIEDSVSFPGYVKNVPQAIEKDGIFVLSSLFEGIPNSLIEAMSTGIPCIATNCTPGGPAYLFNNQERGILVNVHDINAMAHAICNYIENPLFAQEKGRKAVEILEDLKEDKIRDLWIKAFNQIKANGKH